MGTKFQSKGMFLRLGHGLTQNCQCWCVNLFFLQTFDHILNPTLLGILKDKNCQCLPSNYLGFPVLNWNFSEGYSDAMTQTNKNHTQSITPNSRKLLFIWNAI